MDQLKHRNKPEPAIAALLSTLGPPVIGLTVFFGLHLIGINWYWVLFAALSLTGLGHLYAGHVLRGATVGFLGLAIPYLLAMLLAQPAKELDDYMGFIPFLGGIVTSVVWALVAGIDASLLALRQKPPSH